jgi:hypothetical protein
MHADQANMLAPEPPGGVLIETIGSVATQTRHRESANLDLRGRLDIHGVVRRAAGLERRELLARRDEARLAYHAGAVVFLGRASSKHFMANLGMPSAGTRAPSARVEG